jgi:hypothetical protein
MQATLITSIIHEPIPASTHRSPRLAPRCPKQWWILRHHAAALRDRIALTDHRRLTVLTLLSVLDSAIDLHARNAWLADQLYQSAAALACRLAGNWN